MNADPRLPLAKYLVELSMPETGWRDIQAVASRSRRVSEEMRKHGSSVRFLRSVFVPEDGTCFLLYEAPSAEEAGEAAARAMLDVERVVEASRVGGLRPQPKAKGEEREEQDRHAD